MARVLPAARRRMVAGATHSPHDPKRLAPSLARLTAALALVLVGSCGGGDSGTTTDPAVIGLSTTTVSLSGMVGGAAPAPSQVNVSNAGGGSLAGLSVSSDKGWLVPSLNSATAPAVVSVTANTTGMAAGSQTGTVTVSSSGASSKTISVTLVLSQAPVIGLDQTTIAFTASAGGAVPTARTVHISNTGSGSLGTLSVSGMTAWLNASIDQGSGTLTLQPTTTNSSGTFNATLSISSSTAGVAAVSLPVSYAVSAATVVVNPASITFPAVDAGGALPAAQTVSVSLASGGSPGTISVSGTPSWLTVNINQSTQVITLQPSTTASSGSFTTTLSVGSSLAGSAAATLAVSFTVRTLNPVIVLSQSSVDFPGALQNAAVPAAQTVEVTNGGNGSLGTLSLSAAPAWLSASINAGVITLRPTSTATVANYSTTLTVSSSVSGVAAKTLAVSFVVSAIPTVSLNPSSVTFPDAFTGDALPAAQTVAVSMSGGVAPGTISVSGTPSWLTVSIDQGNRSLTLRPNSTATAGSYSATLTVGSSVAGSASSNLPVSFTVRAWQSLTLSTSSANFAAQTGGSLPAAQNITVGTSGGASVGTLDVSGKPSWLDVSIDQGAHTLSVRPNTTASAGSFSATLTVSSNTAGVTSVTIGVNYTVTTPPSIVLSTSSVTFATVMQNAAIPSAQTVTVSNGGGGSLGTISISTPPSWLSASVNNATSVITLVPTSTATVGSYNTTLTVSSSSGATPKTIAVSFEVSSIPTVSLSPTSITFPDVFTGDALPAAQTVTVAISTGGSPGTISVTGTPSWLTVSIDQGTRTLTLRPNSTATVANNAATLTVGSSVAGSVSSSLPVSFNVKQRQSLTLSTSTVTFAAQTGGALPAAQGVTAGATGGAAVGTLDVSGKPSWLDVTIDQGAHTLSLRPNTTASQGSFSATLTVASNTAGVSSVTMNVNYTVTTPPSISLSSSSITFPSVMQNAAIPAAQTVQVTNGGGGSLGTISVSAPPSWLSASVNTSTNVITLVPTSTATVANNSTTLTVSSSTAGVAARTIAVTFNVTAPPPPRILTINPGTGTGSGIVSGGGINCTINNGAKSGACSASYADGSVVALTSTPNVGSIFSTWGNACTGSTTCSVTMNADKTVTAAFTPQNYTLTVSVAGGDPLQTFDVNATWNPATPASDGSTSCRTNVSNSKTCVITFPAQQVVAMGGSWYGAGWFEAKLVWGGACSGESAVGKTASAPPCSITMSGNKSVSLTRQ